MLAGAPRGRRAEPCRPRLSSAGPARRSPGPRPLSSRAVLGPSVRGPRLPGPARRGPAGGAARQRCSSEERRDGPRSRPRLRISALAAVGGSARPRRLPRWPPDCPAGSEERLPSGEAAVLQPVRGRPGSSPLSRSLEFGPRPRGPRSCPHTSTLSPSALPSAAADKRGPRPAEMSVFLA